VTSDNSQTGETPGTQIFLVLGTFHWFLSNDQNFHWCTCLGGIGNVPTAQNSSAIVAQLYMNATHICVIVTLKFEIFWPSQSLTTVSEVVVRVWSTKLLLSSLDVT
jgi:hypothetical protein